VVKGNCDRDRLIFAVPGGREAIIVLIAARIFVTN